MKILDINNVVIDEKDYNISMGQLESEKVLVAHHPAQEYIEEQGHYEVVAEYANGGRTVRWVVDVPGQQECPAWDEYEDIYRLVPYTANQRAEFEISDLKDKLANTDYNIIKIIEGAATLSEMEDIIAQRAVWRARINELEALINA